MNNASSTALTVAEKLSQALRSGQLLKAEAYTPAALSQWLGPHQLTSKPSPFKTGVMVEELGFGGFRLEMAHGVAAGNAGLSFNLVPQGSGRSLPLTVDELLSRWGPPQERVDFVQAQIDAAKGSAKTIGVNPDGSAISPPPIRRRGETRHAMGNTDLSWTLKMPGAEGFIRANVNGDGTIDGVFGSLGPTQ